MNSAKDTIEF